MKQSGGAGASDAEAWLLPCDDLALPAGRPLCGAVADGELFEAAVVLGLPGRMGGRARSMALVHPVCSPSTCQS